MTGLAEPDYGRSSRSLGDVRLAGLAVQASREQPYLSRASHRRGTILSLELRVDVADVGVDGVHRDR